MTDILVCEDTGSWQSLWSDALSTSFPNYRIIVKPSVREGLGKLTGIDLSDVPISVPGIVHALREKNVNYSNVPIVLTDGTLVDNVNRGDPILHGWDLASILRQTGYRGKIAYVGGSMPSQDVQSFFDRCFLKINPDPRDTSPYYPTENAVNYIRTIIPK